MEEAELELAPSGRKRSEIERIFESFLRRQMNLISTVQYIEKRQEEFDDHRRRTTEVLISKFPSLPPDIIAAIVEVNSDPSGVNKVITDIMDTAVASDNGTAVIGALLAAGGVDREPSTPVLYSSLLTTLVGGFEIFVAEIARFAYARFPGSAPMDGVTFTWQQVSTHATIEALREEAAEKAVNDLLRESFDDWIDRFGKRFGVKIPEQVRGLDVREVFQRRNVVVHNSGIANNLYREKLAGLPDLAILGEQLPVTSDYLRSAADRLCAVAWHLSWAFGKRIYKDEDLSVFEMYICNVPYRHLEAERYQAIAYLDCAAVLAEARNEENKMTLRVNSWLAQKRLGNFGAVHDEVENWQTSHLAAKYQLARFALLDNLADGFAIVEEIRGSSELSTLAWHLWPLLQELREYEAALISSAPGPDQLDPPVAS